MPTTIAYRRAVLGLHRRHIDPATFNFVSEFVDRFRLDLHGMFVSDEAVLGLAEMPFVREFSRLGGAWQPLDPQRLVSEFEAEAREAERMFGELKQRLSAACTFEVVRSGAARAMEAVSSRDIMIVPEPSDPVERLLQPFARLFAEAFKSRAAVLLLPPRVARGTGSILVLAVSPDDPAIGTAIAIAVASGEGLVIAGPRGTADDPAIAARCEAAGLPLTPLILPLPSLSMRALLLELAPVQERLIVVARGTLGARMDVALTALGEARRVPVLAVEPEVNGSRSAAE